MFFDSNLFIRCPECKGNLSDSHESPTIPMNPHDLYCHKCGQVYPSDHDILRFVGDHLVAQFSKRMDFVRRLYAYVYTPANRIMFAACGGERRARLEVLDKLELSAGDTILETGSGQGDNFPYLVRQCPDACIWGLDIQQRMLNVCQHNLKRWNINARLLMADAGHLPFADGIFDVVFHLGAFNLFHDKNRALQEMIRVSKPGKRIVIADETEKAARLFRIFTGNQPTVELPDNLVPDNMTEQRLDIIWKGYGYMLSFRKPLA